MHFDSKPAATLRGEGATSDREITQLTPGPYQLLHLLTKSLCAASILAQTNNFVDRAHADEL